MYIAQIIEIPTSSLPAVKHGRFHYKHLEEDKVNALKNLKAHLMHFCIF